MNVLNVSLAALAIGCMQVLGAVEPVPNVQFKKSMSVDANFKPSFVQTNNDWHTLETAYTSYGKLRLKPFPFTLIPKTIHFISLDGALSHPCQQIVKKWADMHPSWTIKVWMKPDLRTFPFLNKKAFLRAKNSAEQTAILAYNILFMYGGLCVDPNFECIRPFDALHQSCKLYTSIGYTATGSKLSPLLIGSVPRHPIIQQCMVAMYDLSGKRNQPMSSRLLSQYFIKGALSSDAEAVAFPLTFFYPPSGQSKLVAYSKLKTKAFIKPETFAFYHQEL